VASADVKQSRQNAGNQSDKKKKGISPAVRLYFLPTSEILAGIMTCVPDISLNYLHWMNL